MEVARLLGVLNKLVLGGLLNIGIQHRHAHKIEDDIPLEEGGGALVCASSIEKPQDICY